uniref:Uncharacterized protein n=1 Tax=Rhizophagus irregularis (strain DAOM 181602 / DAOM 197198 / MUCL 43194) TaxID=747089 RepID=U9TZI7_RHIID
MFAFPLISWMLRLKCLNNLNEPDEYHNEVVFKNTDFPGKLMVSQSIYILYIDLKNQTS